MGADERSDELHEAPNVFTTASFVGVSCNPSVQTRCCHGDTAPGERSAACCATAILSVLVAVSTWVKGTVVCLEMF